MLDELDTVDWGGLEHAYGPARDVPALLHTLASGGPREAEAAMVRLQTSVYHHGSRYPASPAVVPFLVELAGQPRVPDRATLLYLAAVMAADDVTGTADADVTAALTAQVPRLLALLADRDERVRETAGFALARCRDLAPAILVRLSERSRVESAPLVRASLLAAAARLHAPSCADWFAEALTSDDEAVQAAAGYAIAMGRLPWPPAATEVVAAAFASRDPLANWIWTEAPLVDLIGWLPGPGHDTLRLLAALVRAGSPSVREQVLSAGYLLIGRYPAAAATVTPVLRPLLADPAEQVRRRAERVLGSPAAPAEVPVRAAS